MSLILKILLYFERCVSRFPALPKLHQRAFQYSGVQIVELFDWFIGYKIAFSCLFLVGVFGKGRFSDGILKLRFLNKLQEIKVRVSCIILSLRICKQAKAMHKIAKTSSRKVFVDSFFDNSRTFRFDGDFSLLSEMKWIQISN